MLNFIKNVGLLIVIALSFQTICTAQISSEFTVKGQLISKGSNKTSNGEFNVTTYRLEEIELTQPIDLRDEKPPIKKAFRLIVMTGKPLPIGDFSVWVDDAQQYGMQIRPDAVAIVIYARTLTNGATIGLSKREEIYLTERSILLETLSVPSDYATPLEELQARTPIIKLRRLAQGVRPIELRIERFGTKCIVSAAIPHVLEIDGEDYNVGCADRAEVFIYSFSVEDFDQIRDDSEVVIKRGWGRDGRNRRVVGRLNKSSIE